VDDEGGWVAGYAVNPSALKEIPWIPFLKPQRGDGTLELNDVTIPPQLRPLRWRPIQQR
jgi:hypothetical protein